MQGFLLFSLSTLMASVVSSSSGSEPSEISSPAEPFPTSPVVPCLTDDREARETLILSHQIFRYASGLALKTLPKTVGTYRLQLLDTFIGAIKDAKPSYKDHPVLLADEQMKQARCIACALLVNLNGDHPERINEPSFMNHINKLLEAGELDVELSDSDLHLLRVEALEVIGSRDFDKLVEFMESRPIASLPQVFQLLKDYILEFVFTSRNLQSLQYLVSMLDIEPDFISKWQRKLNNR